jgi:hypothetical protein
MDMIELDFDLEDGLPLVAAGGGLVTDIERRLAK